MKQPDQLISRPCEGCIASQGQVKKFPSSIDWLCLMPLSAKLAVFCGGQFILVEEAVVLGENHLSLVGKLTLLVSKGWSCTQDSNSQPLPLDHFHFDLLKFHLHIHHCIYVHRIEKDKIYILMRWGKERYMSPPLHLDIHANSIFLCQLY